MLLELPEPLEIWDPMDQLDTQVPLEKMERLVIKDQMDTQVPKVNQAQMELLDQLVRPDLKVIQESRECQEPKDL